MKILTRVTLAVVLSGASVPGVFAQGMPSTPTPSATPSTAPSTGNDPWSFGVGLNGSYEGNALFTGPEENEEFANQVFATIGRGWALRRGNANVFGNVQQSFFQKSVSLNDFRYTVGGSVNHPITRRLNWNATTMLQSGLARDSQLLTDAGLVLPSVTARTGTTTSTLDYALTKRSSLNWTLSQAGVGFGGGTPFTGGWSVGSVLGWNHLVGRSQAVGVTTDYRRTWDAFPETIYGVNGTWSLFTPGGWSLTAFGGVRPYTVASLPGYQVTSSYGASFGRPLRPGQAIGVSYSKGVERTFGVDRSNHVLHNLGGNYVFTLPKGIGASVGAGYSRGNSPLTPDIFIIGQTAQASLGFPISRKFNVGFSSFFFTRQEEPAGRVRSYRSLVSLGYNTSWR
jgi:hypothetical protein